MKWFASLSSSARFVSTMMGRRRDRQTGGPLRAFTVEMADAHVRVLMAMAAADGAIEAAEIDEVLGYVDRVSLPGRDASALRSLVVRLSSAPPLIDDVVAPLAALAPHSARARALVTDLERIVVATRTTHPRQMLLMEMVCEQFDIANPLVRELSAPQEASAAPTRSAALNLDMDQRLRESVCRALDQMYSVTA